MREAVVQRQLERRQHSGAEAEMYKKTTGYKQRGGGGGGRGRGGQTRGGGSGRGSATGNLSGRSLYKADGSMLTDPWKPLVQRIAPELSSEDFSCVRVPHAQQMQEQEKEQEQEEQQSEEDVEKEFA